jgi:monovalent cation/hydrogen antiporter
MLTFVTAYASYILAEKLHVNGVLSVVTAGLFMGSKQSKIHGPQMRLQAVAVWSFIIALINGLIFILIGLQLPYLIQTIQGRNLVELIGYGLLISLVATVIRFAYVFLADSLSNKIRPRLGLKPVFSSKKETAVLAFTAMRGVVSLAAAFSIPLMLNNGQPFPQHDLILFLTFCVVLFTLVLQGLTLPAFIKMMRFGKHGEQENPGKNIRHLLAVAAYEHVQTRLQEEKIQTPLSRHLQELHRQQIHHFQKEKQEKEFIEKEWGLELQLSALRAKRAKLLEIRDSEEIPIDLIHDLENELDLEEAVLLKNSRHN